ncbi:hypothetical protein T484DRAFT_1935620 [Baffinella frigidus]|nr:hypothetical protein T484DRAFT_1935620 [Cryptophyta sp. CCMP2293]
MERFSFPEEEFAPAGPAPSGGPCDAPGGSKERAAAVKDILETPAGGAAGALLSSRLTAHQWQKVIASPGWQTSVKTRRRMVDPERGARTLTGNYRRGYECQTEFVEWEGVQEEGECDAWVSPSSGADADRFRRPRFFTPRECARLQGFPETFVIAGHRARSSPNRWYHQAGNAVAPPVVAKVARRILEAAAII